MGARRWRIDEDFKDCKITASSLAGPGGFTYKGARIDKTVTVEVDVTEPLVTIDVYGNACEYAWASTPFVPVVVIQGTSFIVVEVATNRQVCAEPYELVPSSTGCTKEQVYPPL